MNMRSTVSDAPQLIDMYLLRLLDSDISTLVSRAIPSNDKYANKVIA